MTDPYGNPLPPGHGEAHDEWLIPPEPKQHLYEVKVWVRVEAASDDEAEELVGGILDGLRFSKHVDAWEIEGEGSTYIVEENIDE